MQSTSHEQATDSAWQQLAPVLEQAMGELGRKDRDAIVLRFFGGKSLFEVGEALGTSEDAAKMRVNRALEKLRKFFGKRGVTLSAALVASTVSAHCVQVAPAQLGASVSAAGLSKAAVSASVPLLVKLTLQHLLWVKLRTALLVTLGLSLAGGGLILNQSKRPPVASRQVIIRLPTNAVAGQRPPTGPGVVRIRMLGTQGLPFEVAYSTDGQSETATGVLPGEVSFNADAYTAIIRVQGPGEFGFELYRGVMQQASAEVGPISGTHSVNLVAKAGGQGISMTGGAR